MALGASLAERQSYLTELLATAEDVSTVAEAQDTKIGDLLSALGPTGQETGVLSAKQARPQFTGIAGNTGMIIVIGLILWAILK
jgi:ABC-type transporter Mla subunit MlaD